MDRHQFSALLLILCFDFLHAALRCPVPTARETNCPREWFYDVTLSCECCFRKSPSWTLRYELAERKCEQGGGTLIAVRTHEHQDFVEQHLNGTSIWLGLRRMTPGGPYIWQEDGRQLNESSFSNWDLQASGAEDCVEIQSNGKWTDVPCDLQTGFICSLDLEKECQSLASVCEWDDVSKACRLRSETEIGYTVAGEKETLPSGFRLPLELHNQSSSAYSQPFSNLYFEVHLHTNHHLQIKILPPDFDRYEVPVPLHFDQDDEADIDLNEIVHIVDESVGSAFQFSITRGGSKLMESVGPLIFEDQFLHFTTNLSSEGLFGLGESIHDTFRHRFREGQHRTTAMFSKDQAPYDGDVNTYGVHPFYLVRESGSQAHGVLFFNSNAMEYETSMSEGQPRLTLRSIGGIFDFHILMGPTMLDVHEQYMGLIGRPFLPPYWGLGFQISRWGYTNLTEVQEVVNATKEAGIPQDVQYVDIDYMDGKKIFTLDEENFGELPEYVTRMKEQGLHFVVILDPPLVIDFSDDYPPAKRGFEANVYLQWGNNSYIPEDQPPGLGNYVVGYMWPDNKTVWPDFFKNSTTPWWIQEVGLLHDLIPWDALWIDMNEPAVFGTNDDKPWNWPEDLPNWSLKCPETKYDFPPYKTAHTSDDAAATGTIAHKTICLSSVSIDDRQPQGSPNKTYRQYDVHSLYGWSQAEPTLMAARQATGNRSMVFSRSTYPGTGQYVGHWYGDNFSRWVDLRRSIILMFEFDMFGLPYGGSDICGFIYNTTADLCLRWQQAGSFYPFSRNHNIWDANPQDPARWENVTIATRNALTIRYRLLPYLYTLFYHAHTRGSPVIRSLITNFQADDNALDVDDQFMWGESLMVAPIVHEGSYYQRNVYFPTISNQETYEYWYDYSSGERIPEGSNITVDVPLTHIPVYLRAGSVLPGKEPALNTMLSRQNAFHLLVIPNSEGSATGNLFWDDGDSQDTISKGEFHYLTFRYEENNLKSTVIANASVVADEEMVLGLVEIYGYPEQPRNVTVDDGEILSFNHDDEKSILTIYSLFGAGYEQRKDDEHAKASDLTAVVSECASTAPSPGGKQEAQLPKKLGMAQEIPKLSEESFQHDVVKLESPTNPAGLHRKARCYYHGAHKNVHAAAHCGHITWVHHYHHHAHHGHHADSGT
ncbi:unnamed protein product [Cyprideis torosa]|uniref:Uncharacterized protein n=1 Tax=Cyprideis torosa TaxID=163714 RepID=A0A7R8W753_9CRUS|nr:unnamed protein product [Cyprideis torosa]CAG0884820.1 unnamed protein product [Cyprideis torosa]